MCTVYTYTDRAPYTYHCSTELTCGLRIINKLVVMFSNAYMSFGSLRIKVSDHSIPG